MGPKLHVLLLALGPLLPQGGARLQIERPGGEIVERDLEGLAVESLEELGAVLVRLEGAAPAETGAPATVERPTAEVRLRGGDLLLGRVAGGEGDLLRVVLAGDTPIELSVDHIQSLAFPARLSPGELAALSPAEVGDRLYWSRPGALDRVDGTVEAFGPEGVRMESVLGRKTFPWGEVAALFVEQVGDLAPPAGTGGGAAVVVDLTDGSRLRGRLVSFDERALRLERSGSGEIELPTSVVREIARDDGTLRFLSDLHPASAVEGSPFGDELGMSFSHRMDRSVVGGPLTAGGRTYTRGIGVHAPSRLTWSLDGTWSTLRGQVAIDDSVLLLPYRGSVEFRILADGEPRWTSGEVRGGEPPRDIEAIDLRGARELVLEVDMASRFHVADRANWLRVRLVRE